VFVSAIIAAGGRGRRVGSAQPKQLLEVGGQTVLQRTVGIFDAHDEIDEIVVALPADLAARPPAYLSGRRKPLKVVAGGERRQDSVANAFGAIDADADIVLIHDAARPFVSAALVSQTIAAAVEAGAALAAVPARDTVKEIAAARMDAGPLFVKATLPRERIYLAQTPQGFRRAVLEDAIKAGARERTDATDEAALAERAGHAVRVVEGDLTNIKITTRDDLDLAGAIANRQGKPPRTGRAGTGYDLHRLVAGRPLVLGGVVIPFDRGPAGHSDGDAVCHAVTDALLGAAAAGDIGQHFPDTDPRWKDASSLDLLRRAVGLLAEAGQEVGNVDVTVIIERPKLAPYIAAMRASVAGAIGIGSDRVSIKAKTNEGVGELGRGEAVAVHAVALVRSGGSRS